MENNFHEKPFICWKNIIKEDKINYSKEQNRDNPEKVCYRPPESNRNEQQSRVHNKYEDME